ncbi:alkaline phosphatase [Halobacteriovorax marinus]|uniref:DedA-family integral membrane protein n=1 Tax=Halobacteriovorax marinus (strain ATCC BAA-682 / DSM 15412 / SJ) TaxID=862908 RepID=E1X680_HALMS|nr:DedA family protein [Halobacteriovorax marinus]ATH08727.1 alkaline phosphatase [Halobacteriovorax marinus]CBW27425.1 DedA-family integral membrane protein [Halobacteriovorax marinus SJ]
MEMILEYIQANVAIAPYLIFGLLFLAGFNLPVSEDIMLFVSALIASKNPEYTYQLFAAVFLGAYVSDLICYGFMGRFLGNKIFKLKFFASIASPEKIEKVNNFYNKYGIMTLLIGRFIPFGVRNALFLTAGLGKMNAWKFAISDLIACTISCVSFFALYYNYGETVIEYVKKGNIILFSIALIGVVIFFIKKKKDQKALNSL